MHQIVYTPIDIPPIPNKEKILKNFEGAESFVWWGEETLLGDKKYNNPLGYPQEWTEKSKKYPELRKWIEFFFPLDELWYIRIARASQAIPPHIDSNKVIPDHKHHLSITQEALDHLHDNVITGYRFIVSGSRDKLYICDEYDYSRDMTWQEKKYARIPETTDAFALNPDQPHGVDEDTSDRLVGFILGKINKEKHNALLLRSISKYNEYVVRKNV